MNHEFSIILFCPKLRQFRKLHDDEGHEMENNFRPVQELHDRKVTYRLDDSNATSISEWLSYVAIDIVSP